MYAILKTWGIVKASDKFPAVARLKLGDVVQMCVLGDTVGIGDTVIAVKLRQHGDTSNYVIGLPADIEVTSMQRLLCALMKSSADVADKMELAIFKRAPVVIDNQISFDMRDGDGKISAVATVLLGLDTSVAMEPNER